MTVATEDDFRPFEFTKDGKPTGYDQELLETFKKKAGFEVRQDIIPWTGILPGVTTGKYDAAVTAILVTQERMKTLDFCAPSPSRSTTISSARATSKIQGIKDLERPAARRRGRQRHAQAAAAARRHAQGDRRHARQDRILPGLPGSVSGLGGRPRRLCGQRLAQPGRRSPRRSPTPSRSAKPVSKPTYIAWPVVKGNTDLLALMNDFLLGARKDGSMYALQKKYFDTTYEHMPEVPAASV